MDRYKINQPKKVQGIIKETSKQSVELRISYKFQIPLQRLKLFNRVHLTH